MPRKPVVSKTFHVHSVNVEIVSKLTAEKKDIVFQWLRPVNDRKLMRMIQAQIGVDWVVLNVSEPTIIECHKEMPEEEFFKLAKETLVDIK